MPSQCRVRHNVNTRRSVFIVFVSCFVFSGNTYFSDSPLLHKGWHFADCQPRLPSEYTEIERVGAIRNHFVNVTHPSLRFWKPRNKERSECA